MCARARTWCVCDVMLSVSVKQFQVCDLPLFIVENNCPKCLVAGMIANNTELNVVCHCHMIYVEAELYEPQIGYLTVFVLAFSIRS